MPIRRLTIHACVTAITLASCSLASANTSLWKGSYAADGQCFCAGSLGQDIDSVIIPTPVGGQSIAQVCERIGSGPELQKVNGKFNFTVYSDYQCGHGHASDVSTDAHCAGNLGVSGEDCQSAGPKWDLAQAYSDDKPAQPGISESPSANGIPRYITPPKRAAKAENDTLETTAQSQAKSYAQSGHTPVEEIAKLRQSSTKVETAASPRVKKSETREELRARQLEHIAQARKRAALPLAKAVDDKPAAKESKKQSIEAAATVVAKATEKSEEPVAESSSSTPSIAAAKEPEIAPPTQLSAMQFPISLERGSGEFDYVEGAPVRYDFGGAGVRVTASKSSHDRIQYVLRAAAADSYQEVSVGLGFFVTPEAMPRLTLLLSGGMESGRFEFRDDDLSARLSDTGAFFHVGSRFAVTSKFRLQTGVGYSSFFEGDFIGFGEALFNITKNLDLSSRIEAGDNDLFSFGVRYHY